MRTEARVCFGNRDALTDVDQNACSFKNLVIDILQRYVGNHVLDKVLRKDDWESGSLRKHDAWEFERGVVRGKGQTEKRRIGKNKAKSGTEREGTYRSHDLCVFLHFGVGESFKDKSRIRSKFDTCLLITILAACG